MPVFTLSLTNCSNSGVRETFICLHGFPTALNSSGLRIKYRNWLFPVRLGRRYPTVLGKFPGPTDHWLSRHAAPHPPPPHAAEDVPRALCSTGDKIKDRHAAQHSPRFARRSGGRIGPRGGSFAQGPARSRRSADGRSF